MSTDGPATQGVGLPRRRLDDVPGLQAEGDDVLRGAGDGPTSGPGGDEGSALASAAALRFPGLKGLAPRERIEALIDYVSETAIHRGAVEELRLTAYIDLRDAKRALGAVPTGVSRNPRASDDARRASRPDLAVRIDDAQWVIDRCKEQVNRLEHDYDAASRAYTLLAG